MTPGAPIRIARLRAWELRAPIDEPVRTSFGVMHERPALFVRVEDDDGAFGWGEVWCNFPSVGATHRLRLLDSVIAPLVVGTSFDDPAAAWSSLTAATAVLALQAGEPGPLAQCIAGVDCALWDLAARRLGQPLWQALGGADDAIGVYASGINPDRPEEAARRLRDVGHAAFKLKVGFGDDRDIANLAAVRAEIGADAGLMADANQGWSLEQARTMVARCASFDLGWIEEPLRADRPDAEWRELAHMAPMPIAAGENVADEAAFDRLFAAQAVRIVQPDAAKWGGVSRCVTLGHRARAEGLRYCPHYLGGGVGLLASAHLLAAVGGDGLLEIDGNPNPLREEACGPLAQIREGRAHLGRAPGIGVVSESRIVERYAVAQIDRT